MRRPNTVVEKDSNNLSPPPVGFVYNILYNNTLTYNNRNDIFQADKYIILQNILYIYIYVWT